MVDHRNVNAQLRTGLINIILFVEMPPVTWSNIAWRLCVSVLVGAQVYNTVVSINMHCYLEKAGLRHLYQTLVNLWQNYTRWMKGEDRAGGGMEQCKERASR